MRCGGTWSCSKFKKAAPMGAAFVALRRRRGCCMQCLVPGDEFGFLLGGGLGGGNGAEADQPLDRLFAQHMLAVELGHAGVFGGAELLCVAGADVLLAGGLGDAQIVQRVVAVGVDVLGAQGEVVADDSAYSPCARRRRSRGAHAPRTTWSASPSCASSR